MITSNKRLAIFLLILVFILGIATGILVTPLAVKSVSRNLASLPSDQPAKKLSRVEMLSQELQLRAEQKEHLSDIIGRSQGRYRQLNKEYAPRCDEIRNETRSAIMQILDDEQKGRFQAHIERNDRERQKKHSRPRHEDD